ncbi:hypothetical protein CY34DRAFT_720102 [Suillus luteus UH-Slu-Lm8-n1]|uniref:Uncharacterized protein n=1 Tax=Suillus luteus UH-Slu-Lm8-n1 TaxID=930992 RepID=A0A0C9Z6W6_9AGAM|nr:hypothetical protein CY34DRAFT_720102 [Suillus luteus UH-Slu-Lm8-n1]
MADSSMRQTGCKELGDAMISKQSKNEMNKSISMTGNECTFISHSYIERVLWTAAISLSGNRPLIRNYEGLERVDEPWLELLDFMKRV